MICSGDFAARSDFSPTNFATIVRALHLLNDIKDQFIGALEAVGEIDAYCSSATLIEEHRSLPNGFCIMRSSMSLVPIWIPIRSMAVMPV